MKQEIIKSELEVNDNKINSMSKFSNILKQNYENINNYTLDINYLYSCKTYISN